MNNYNVGLTRKEDVESLIWKIENLRDDAREVLLMKIFKEYIIKPCIFGTMLWLPFIVYFMR